MTNKIIKTIKETVHGMSSTEIIKAYKEFTSSGDKLGKAIIIDEIEARHPEIYAKHYNPETYDLDKDALIKGFKEADKC